jgi:hypothetical protein
MHKLPKIMSAEQEHIFIKAKRLPQCDAVVVFLVA